MGNLALRGSTPDLAAPSRVLLSLSRWLLAKATCVFGDHRLVDRSEEIAAWRARLPEGHRFEATQALRQVLNRAVAWKILNSNPAKTEVDNPRRQHPEKRPFESWAEIDALAEQLGPVYGPMIVFAAATGLRPSEWTALEQRDLDREAGVALQALERLPARREVPLLFPAPRGGYLDLHNFRRRAWRPAQLAARIEPLRLRAGISTLRSIPLHGSKPDDDRSPLRPPRPRRARARGRAPREAL